MENSSEYMSPPERLRIAANSLQLIRDQRIKGEVSLEIVNRVLVSTYVVIHSVMLMIGDFYKLENEGRLISDDPEYQKAMP